MGGILQLVLIRMACIHAYLYCLGYWDDSAVFMAVSSVFYPTPDMRRDVQEVFKNTPHEKQVMMFSATLPKEIRPVCKKFMNNVNHLLLASGLVAALVPVAS